MEKIAKVCVTLSAVVLILGRPAPADAKMKPLAAVKAFDVAWNEHNLEKVMSLCAKDVVFSFSLVPGQTQTFRGKEQVRVFVEKSLAGFHVDSRDHVTTGSEVHWKSDAINDVFRSKGLDIVHLEEEAVVEDGFIMRVAAVATPASAAQIQDALEEGNRRAILDFIETVFNRHDFAAVDKFIAENYVDHMPFSGFTPDLPGFKVGLAGYFSAFPDCRVMVEDSIAEGDKVAIRVKTQATHKGEFMGQPASNRPVTLEETHFARFADGKIVEHWGQRDSAVLIRQIEPAPAKRKK